MVKENLIVKLTESLSFEMIFVKGGSFSMGGSDKDAMKREKPIHGVDVSDFFLAKFPVTQNLYKTLIGKNPSSFEGENRPVEKVSWNDAKAFIEKLNQQTGKQFRLPTEAEWEFSARGGNESEEYLYAGSDKLEEVGWFKNNSDGQTHSVGQKMPNELGLYDMCGNVWEWCEDDYHSNYDGAPADGSAWIDQPKRGRNRVLRGGSWLDGARGCRATVRNFIGPGDRSSDIGFRLACSSF